ncbi:MAG TPA: hypothetical protein PLD88_02025 [Candidatus Berkiella sp.]|nr:hypothetical protein [Candidatus Berkiella sp.]
MSKLTNPLIQQFTQMLSNGDILSEQEIAQNSLEMMQILAKNPVLRGSWLSLKETLQTIYNSLDDNNEINSVYLQTAIVQKLYKNSLN